MPVWTPNDIDWMDWPPRPATDRHARRRGTRRRLGRMKPDRSGPALAIGWAGRMLAAFFAGGWPRTLTGTERSVWLATLHRADPTTGICQVSLNELADLLRMAKQSSLSKARATLLRYGLLREVDAGGGRGRAKAVRMVLPPPIASPDQRPPSRPPKPPAAKEPPAVALPAVDDFAGHLWGPRR